MRKPEPKIEIMSGGICVTLFKDIYNEKYLKSFNYNDRQLKAVFYVKENDKITNSEYRDLFKVSEKTAFRDLEKIVQLNIIKKIGEKKETFYELNV